jgi:hypothetical protein
MLLSSIAFRAFPVTLFEISGVGIWVRNEQAILLLVTLQFYTTVSFKKKVLSKVKLWNRYGGIRPQSQIPRRQRWEALSSRPVWAKKLVNPINKQADHGRGRKISV